MSMSFSVGWGGVPHHFAFFMGFTDFMDFMDVMDFMD